MKADTALSSLYVSALPPVRDRPMPTMPNSLYAYIYKVSGRQQLRLCLFTLVVFPLTLAPLELQRRIVNHAVAKADLGMLLELGALYFLVYLSLGIIKYFRNVYLARVAEGTTRRLRTRMVRSDAFGADPEEGTRQSILSSEAEKIGGFVAESLASPLMQASILVSITGYMFLVQPEIAAAAAAFLIPSTILVASFQPTLNRLSEKKITVRRGLGESVLRRDGDEGDDDSRARRLIEQIYQVSVRLAVIKHLVKALNNLINHMGPLSILMLGGWLVIQGRTEVGTLVAFMSGYQHMTRPARDLLSFYRRLSIMRVQYGLVHDAGMATEAAA